MHTGIFPRVHSSGEPCVNFGGGIHWPVTGAGTCEQVVEAWGSVDHVRRRSKKFLDVDQLREGKGFSHFAWLTTFKTRNIQRRARIIIIYKGAQLHHFCHSAFPRRRTDRNPDLRIIISASTQRKKSPPYHQACLQKKEKKQPKRSSNMSLTSDPSTSFIEPEILIFSMDDHHPAPTSHVLVSPPLNP